MCIRDSTQPSGQSELVAAHPARGGRGPSTPNWPNGPLRSSESAKVGDSHSAGPDARGAELRTAPQAS
eukprot:9884614-Alexandrium_andersonii.AAC.1